MRRRRPTHEAPAPGRSVAASRSGAARRCGPADRSSEVEAPAKAPSRKDAPPSVGRLARLRLRRAAIAATIAGGALVPHAAAAHVPFGLENAWLGGAALLGVFPETAAALAALGALAARQESPAAALCAAAGAVAGGFFLLFAHWGFAPGGLAAPLVAGTAGLLALLPARLPRLPLAAAAFAGGAALGLSTDLHPPFELALRLAAGSALASAALTLAIFGTLRLIPRPTRGIACAVLGSWAAAAAALSLAFRAAV